jgi:hypothetical protein
VARLRCRPWRCSGEWPQTSGSSGTTSNLHTAEIAGRRPKRSRGRARVTLAQSPATEPRRLRRGPPRRQTSAAGMAALFCETRSLSA